MPKTSSRAAISIPTITAMPNITFFSPDQKNTNTVSQRATCMRSACSSAFSKRIDAITKSRVSCRWLWFAEPGNA